MKQRLVLVLMISNHVVQVVDALPAFTIDGTGVEMGVGNATMSMPLRTNGLASELCITDVRDGGTASATITVLRAGIMSATYGPFTTQSIVKDFLIIKGTKFGSTTVPANLHMKVGETFTWKSDGRVGNVSCTLCLRPVVVEEYFSITGTGVVSGDTSGGSLRANLRCITDGVGSYGPNEDATVTVRRSGVVSAKGAFNVVSAGELLINGVEYRRGATSPVGVSVAAADMITWKTTGGGGGFTLCWAPGTLIGTVRPDVNPVCVKDAWPK